jgi:hypothetical protein
MSKRKGIELRAERRKIKLLCDFDSKRKAFAYLFMEFPTALLLATRAHEVQLYLIASNR